MPIEANAIVFRRRELVFSRIDDEFVCADIDAGMLFSFNVTAYRIWELLCNPVPVETLCRQIAEEYGVAVESCRSDVVALLETFLRRTLIEQRLPDAPGQDAS
jgi:hypothetical protein